MVTPTIYCKARLNHCPQLCLVFGRICPRFNGLRDPQLLQTRLASELLSDCESISFGVEFLHLKRLSKKEWVVFQLTHGEGLCG